MSRRPVLLALAFVGLLGVGRSSAEDIDPASLFDSAKTAYGEKKYGKVMQDLNLLAKEVGRLRMEVLKGTLPGAPEGWSAQEAEGDAGAAFAWFAAGISVRREYRKGEEQQMSLALTADSPAVATQAAFIMQPQFLPPNAKIVKMKGRPAVLEYDKEQKSGSLKVLLNMNTSLVELQGRSVTREEIDAFGNAVDYDKIEKTLQE